jgi:hypothetical protein
LVIARNKTVTCFTSDNLRPALRAMPSVALQACSRCRCLARGMLRRGGGGAAAVAAPPPSEKSEEHRAGTSAARGGALLVADAIIWAALTAASLVLVPVLSLAGCGLGLSLSRCPLQTPVVPMSDGARRVAPGRRGTCTSCRAPRTSLSFLVRVSCTASGRPVSGLAALLAAARHAMASAAARPLLSWPSPHCPPPLRASW